MSFDHRFLKLLKMEGAGTANVIPGLSGTGSVETHSFTAEQFQQLMATIAAAGNVEEVLDEKLGKLKEEIYQEQEMSAKKRDWTDRISLNPDGMRSTTIF